MRKLFFLLLPVIVFAQQPTRQYSFLPEHQYKYGENTISPDGKKVLLSFNEGDKAMYELVDAVSFKLISTGSFSGRPASFSWSDDGAMLSVDYIGKPSECFDARNGLKLVFTCNRDGSTAFTRSNTLGTKLPAILYLFNQESVYQYSLTGKLIDSTEQDDFDFFGKAWYNMYTKNFCVTSDLGSELFYYNAKGEKVRTVALDKIILVTEELVDKNGSLYLYGDGKKLHVYDTYTDKLIFIQAAKEYFTVVFTPDSKNILLKTKDGYEKINLETKQTTSLPDVTYFKELFFTTFGTELICVDSKGLKAFNCKDYLPIKTVPAVKDKPVPAVVTPPSTKTTPTVTPKEHQNISSKWSFPYKVTDFITPLPQDSFYLWTPDRSLKKAIVYKRTEDGVLWKNAFSYYDYFGFSSDPKFAQVNTYILDNTDSSSRVASYSKFGLIEKPMMFGGQSFIVKLPSAGKRSVSWTNDMYGEKANWSASVIDNVYKSVKAKCLVVTRKEVSNGQQIDETYYYQQGVGLIKIESAGKIYMQR